MNEKISVFVICVKVINRGEKSGGKVTKFFASG